MDALKNFAYTTVLTAPSPATSGTSLVVASGGGALLPAAPFNLTVWPAGAQPSAANAEIVRVTAKSTDTLTIVRAQESSSARTIVVGDQVAATVTVKTLNDIIGDVVLCAAPTGVAATDNANVAAGLTAAAGKTLRLRSGTYNLSAQIIPASFTKIVGDKSTILEFSQSGVLIDLTTVDFVVFEGMEIRGTNASFTAIKFDGTFGSSLNNVKVKGTHTLAVPQASQIGLDFTGNSGDNYINNNSQIENLGIGVRVASYANFFDDTKIDECQYGVYFVNSYSSGIVMNNCSMSSTPGGITISQIYIPNAAGYVLISNTNMEGATNTIRVGSGTLYDGPTQFSLKNCHLSGTTKVLDIQSVYGCSLVGVSFTFDPTTTPTTLTINATGAPVGFAAGLITNVTADAEVIATSVFPAGWTYFGTAGSKFPTNAALVLKSLYDANTVLAANSDDTPAAVTMAASTILARLASGNIKAASVAEILTLLDTPTNAQTVLKTLYDANTVLAATTDDTPAAITMGASTILARLAAGNIKAASVSEIRTLLDVPTNAEAILDALIDAKGDSLWGTAADTVARLPVGTPGQILAADPNATAGVKWVIRPRNEMWLPSGAICETVPRTARLDIVAPFQTGRVSLHGGCVIPAGVTVTNISFHTSSTALGTPTNWWFCLVDQALNILRITADQTTTAWATNTLKTLALSSTYTPTVDIAVYLGVMLKGGTMPSMFGSVVSAAGTGVPSISPPIAGMYTQSLTTPASFTSVTGFAAADLVYAYLT